MAQGRGLSRMPSAVVELLRLCVVIFFAGLGYEIALVVEGSGHRDALGGIDPLWVGLILGTGLGFVLGGVLGRATERTVAKTERSLHDLLKKDLVRNAKEGAVNVAYNAAWSREAATQPRLATARTQLHKASAGGADQGDIDKWTDEVQWWEAEEAYWKKKRTGQQADRVDSTAVDSVRAGRTQESPRSGRKETWRH